VTEAPEPADLAAALVTLGRWAGRATPGGESSLRSRVDQHLGVPARELDVVRETVGAHDRVNLQVALDAWAQAPRRGIESIGLPAMHGWRMGIGELVQAELEVVPSGGASLQWASEQVGERRISILRAGLLLIEDGDRRLAGMIGAGEEHFDPEDRSVALDVIAPDREDAEAFLAEIRRLMVELNVYRGRVLEIVGGHMGGGISVEVRDVPDVPRDRIVLPDGTLEAIERHTVGFAAQAERLLAAGRHLKRGLLLHGPPGTGKTLTAMHLAGRMPGRTVFLLTGAALYGVGTVCAMARTLAPAMIVLEDVDLVAEDREMMEDANPILFTLLNEMDGIAEDADIVFVLTTNRPQVLEPALASRPGRVDQAVELPLPDADGRRRLLGIYGAGLDLPDAAIADAVERTEGMSPAYVRELVRRAALIAAQREDGAIRVTGDDLSAAVDELATGGAVTQVVLGARPPRDPELIEFEDDEEWGEDAY
jgi:hypothetical protein